MSRRVHSWIVSLRCHRANRAMHRAVDLLGRAQTRYPERYGFDVPGVKGSKRGVPK